MILYKRDKNMLWNLDNVRFLYPPDDFTGTFANAKMQERHKALQDQKIKVILDHLENQSNPLEAMKGLHDLDHMQFLRNNLEKFRAAGCLEKTVLKLYYRKNTPFAAFGDYEEWKALLLQCDPTLLAAEGEPCPFEKCVAYRGSVTGKRQGLSWTINKKEVAWFLERWKDKELGGGSVFAVEISKGDVMVYSEDAQRQEVILHPAVAEAAEIKEIEAI